MNLVPAANSIKLALAAILVAMFSLLASSTASAAFDVSDVTDEITLAVAAVAIIGAAVLVIKVGIKAWKWIGRAM